MRMTATFALNQLITHGFGVYLFAALVALMQNSVGITHWHLALIGALSQLSYLAGAMLMGAFGDRLDSGRSMLVTGSVISVSLLSMAWLENPVLIVAVLTLMSACAAISWSSLAELTTRYGDPQYHSTNLSTAASGTAWGFSLNGLLLLMLVPQFGWRSGWIVATHRRSPYAPSSRQEPCSCRTVLPHAHRREERASVLRLTWAARHN